MTTTTESSARGGNLHGEATVESARERGDEGEHISESETKLYERARVLKKRKNPHEDTSGDGKTYH